MKFFIKFIDFTLILNLCVFQNALSFDVNARFATQGRIVNGVTARIEDFPYQLSLRRAGQHICGASVLDSTWAISAAHCVDGYDYLPMLFSFRIGSPRRLSGGEVLTVNKIYMHPDYNHDTVHCDVALLRTNFNRLRGTSVHPIKLPYMAEPINTNALALISGWGHMSSRSNILSNVLRFAKVYIVDQNECKSRLSQHGILTDAMFCAAAPNTDACQGDSGGPIQINGELVGVVSWGVGCADPSFPGVYTRLAYPAIRAWIQTITKL